MTAGITEILKKLQKIFKLEEIAVALITSYSIVSALMLIFTKLRYKINFSDIAFFETSKTLISVALIAAVFAVLYGVSFKDKDIFKRKMTLFCSVSIYFILLCCFNFNEWFFLFLCIFLAVAVYYCFRELPERFGIEVNGKLPEIVAVAGGLAVFAVTAAASVAEFKSFNADNFDMGVYSQMFSYLSKTGSAFTTCSGYELISKFTYTPAPILYFFVPLYMITRNMIPCLIAQSAIVASGVIPLYLLCRIKQRNSKTATLIILAYILSVAVFKGALYDFHEQCILAPTVLWLMYFAEKNSKPLFVLFCVLTALVGTDGIILLFFIGLYTAVGKNKRTLGALAVVLSGIAFAAVKIFAPNASFIGAGDYSDAFLLKSVFINPGYIFKSMLTADKAAYLIMMFIPFGLVPLITEKYSSYILTVPIFVFLISANVYAASVNYNHAFGVAALIVYLFAENFPHLKTNIKRFAAAFCTVACLMSFFGFFNLCIGKVTDYTQSKQLYCELEESLGKIPVEASVTASTQLTAYLADREIIYPWYHFEEEDSYYNQRSEEAVYSSDYTVLTLYDGDVELKETVINGLIDSGFVLFERKDGVVAILLNPNPANG